MPFVCSQSAYHIKSFVALITKNNNMNIFLDILHYLFLLECKFQEDDFSCLVLHYNPSALHTALQTAGTQYAFVKLMTCGLVLFILYYIKLIFLKLEIFCNH